jgi:hypothetical protein
MAIPSDVPTDEPSLEPLVGSTSFGSPQESPSQGIGKWILVVSIWLQLKCPVAFANMMLDLIKSN